MNKIFLLTIPFFLSYTLPSAGMQQERKVTMLHMYASLGHLDEMQKELAKKISTESRDNYGATPLHWAARSKKKPAQSIQLLLDHGANINAIESLGNTPLFETIKKNNSAAVKCLLEHGAKMEVKNKYGETALEYAINKGNLKIVTYLIKQGVKIAELYLSSINRSDKDSGSKMRHLLVIALETFIVNDQTLVARMTKRLNGKDTADIENSLIAMCNVLKRRPAVFEALTHIKIKKNAQNINTLFEKAVNVGNHRIIDALTFWFECDKKWLYNKLLSAAPVCSNVDSLPYIFAKFGKSQKEIKQLSNQEKNKKTKRNATFGKKCYDTSMTISILSPQKSSFLPEELALYIATFATCNAHAKKLALSSN